MWDRIENISTATTSLAITGSLIHVDWQFQYAFHLCGLGTHPLQSMCSNTVSIAAPVLPRPKAPVRTAAFAQSEHDVTVVFSAGDDDVSAWFEVERLDVNKTVIHPGSSQGARGWKTLSPRISAGRSGALRDPVQPDFRHAPVTPLTYRVCAGNVKGRTCTEPFEAKASRVIHAAIPN
jgi:hypothetical protein